MPQIDSTHISNVEYDETEQTLTVDFVKGGSYIYFDVPKDVYDGMFLAESASVYFRQNIKDVFGFERVE
jgi:hypothetical protein